MEHFCPSAFGRLPARRLLLSSPRPRPPPSQPPASSTLPRLSLHPAPPEGRSRPPRYAVCITATTVDPRRFCQLHPAPGDCVHMALPVLDLVIALRLSSCSDTARSLQLSPTAACRILDCPTAEERRHIQGTGYHVTYRFFLQLVLGRTLSTVISVKSSLFTTSCKDWGFGI